MLVEGCEHVIRKLVGLAIGRNEEVLSVNQQMGCQMRWRESADIDCNAFAAGERTHWSVVDGVGRLLDGSLQLT